MSIADNHTLSPLSPQSGGADVIQAGNDLPPATSHLVKMLPWGALVGLLLITAFAFQSVSNDSENDARDRFESREAAVVEAIEQRMTVYIQALRGGLGLFRSSDSVTRDEWRVYAETLRLDEIYPGIQGIGYAEWVRAADRASYEADIRAQGFADFTIRPAEEREIYSSIIFLEPFDERNRQAFGFDMYSQETRRSAMDLARDTGQVAISGRVTLVQEISEDVQAGFLMYLPFYGQQTIPNTLAGRRAASTGFVYSAFRMGNLMAGILGPGTPDVRLQIYDGEAAGDDLLMYAGAPRDDDKSPVFVGSNQIVIGQRPWTIQVSSLPVFEKQLDPEKSYIVLFLGVFTSLLIFGILWTVGRTRERAHSIAVGMTLALNQHADELARSNEDLEQFAYIASHDLKAPLRGIDNLASWIEEDLGDRLVGETKEHMQLLRGRVRRLEALLTDLLNYSRARQVSSELGTVDLRDLITTTWEMLNTDARMTLDLDIRLDTETVETQVSALQQVLTNLFSNAVKHHDRDHGTVFLRVTESFGLYCFSVADDGPGIATDQRERAFKMFQTLRPRDEVEGSGMGLAIIRKLIDRIGGTIDVGDRAGGRGAEFCFSWPDGKAN